MCLMTNKVPFDNNIDIKLMHSFAYYLEFNRMYAKNTIESYLSDIHQFYDFLLRQKTNLSGIQFQHIIDFLHHHLMMGDRTRARKLAAIKHFIHFIHDYEKIDISQSHIDEVRMKVQVDKFPFFLEEEELKKLFQSIDQNNPKGMRDIAIIEMLYSCGLRVSELTNLTFDQLDLEEGWIRVLGKGSKERLVPIGKVLEKTLNRYFKESYAYYEHSKKNKKYLFLNKYGDQFSRIGIWKVIKFYAFKSGIKNSIYPHILRHTFATHLLSHGADIRVVQELLGHSSLVTTQIYTHIKKEELKAVIDMYHPFSQEEI